jgi:hypothetical protein
MKIKRTKGAGNVAQVVEHLHSNCKILNSNPSTEKKNDGGFTDKNKHRSTRNAMSHFSPSDGNLE